jgi:hypothetical protein
LSLGYDKGLTATIGSSSYVITTITCEPLTS